MNDNSVRQAIFYKKERGKTEMIKQTKTQKKKKRKQKERKKERKKERNLNAY